MNRHAVDGAEAWKEVKVFIRGSEDPLMEGSVPTNKHRTVCKHCDLEVSLTQLNSLRKTM
jgi:hypothetical protein